MKLKFSERVVDYFVQAVFIFISVFLAFWLSNYQRENYIEFYSLITKIKSQEVPLISNMQDVVKHIELKGFKSIAPLK